MNEETPRTESQEPAIPLDQRQPDAIYQGGRIVARAVDPEVDLDAREIRFAEVTNSDYLALPEECEFQKYRILVQRIAYASRVEKGGEHKGRVLRGVVAEVLGYWEQ